MMNNIKSRSVAILMGTLTVATLQAETQPVPAAVPGITIRAGSANTGIADTVVFNVSGDDAANNSPVTSTNPIEGGFANFTVQFLMETRPPPGGTGQFLGNSSQAMACQSPITCGTTNIPFNSISWTTRDNDMLELASSFSGAGNQLLHTQQEPVVNTGFGTRVTDYAEFTFSNSELRPAGTYAGTVTFTGNYP